MNKRIRSKGVLESIRSRKTKRQNIIKKALRGKDRPITLEGLRALQVDGRLDLETLSKHIGVIFPFILNQISEGVALKDIERLFGMKDRSLITFIARYEQLAEEIKKAREIRVDRDHDLIDIFS